MARGSERFPADPRFPLVLARLELNANRREKALEYLKSITTKFPDDPNQLWALGIVLADLDRKDEVEQVIKQLIEKDRRLPADQLAHCY